MSWFKQHRYQKILIETIVIAISFILLVYPLEVNARDLVRIQHSGAASGGVSSGSVRESYEASRRDQERQEAKARSRAARDTLESARANQLRIQSQGPSSDSPNSYYRELMDAQGEVDRAQSDLREQNNRSYWERRR